MRQELEGPYMTAASPNQDPRTSCVPDRSTPSGVCGLRQVQTCQDQVTQLAGFGDRCLGARHEAWEEGRRENVRHLDQGQKSLDSLSGAEADSHPGWVPPEAQPGRRVLEAGWEQAALQWKWYSKQKRLGRQNKALPLNKCSVLRQPEQR